MTSFDLCFVNRRGGETERESEREREKERGRAIEQWRERERPALLLHEGKQLQKWLGAAFTEEQELLPPFRPY